MIARAYTLSIGNSFPPFVSGQMYLSLKSLRCCKNTDRTLRFSRSVNDFCKCTTVCENTGFFFFGVVLVIGLWCSVMRGCFHLF